MKNPDSFAERQKAVQTSKTRLLERFKARPAADDPAMVAKAAERRAVEEAREARRAAREEAERARREEIEAEARAREAAEQAARDAAQAAFEAEAGARREAELAQARRVIEDEVARKALRDKRYAERKARVRR
ncbi:DUF6481 family protein [Ancylobacter sp. A5.8]|uniref:DUF6481 family protein n=1 Tax=Ancylobacter gelatini TaxID=2919920 RepID=UPI001F4DA3F5|nr:DUF6481 family protein [Ancylobacter gelatini]MCJ8143965.1 DUF6481 family protein [Ancylobacter gelatini]